MAQVIKGKFPSSHHQEEKREEKPAASYILHISIAFSDPLIWRRIQVPGHFNLSRLHEVIQGCMGWSDSHVHQFLIGKICYEPTGKKSAILHESKRFDENKYKLSTLEDDMRFLFTYLYGAGEGWEHLIQLEEIVPASTPLKKPVLLGGERACPPESVDDVHEYQALLAAMESPGHKNQTRLFELSGRSDFDPAFVDLETIRQNLAAAF